MGIGRTLLCILFPPLAVIDRGCGSLLLVTLLTLAGWVPGVIGALVINTRKDQSRRMRRFRAPKVIGALVINTRKE